MSREPHSADLGTQRVAVIAHGLGAGGGISVGRNLIAALGRVAPQHDYLLVVPSGAGYDEACAEVPNHRRIEYLRRGGPWRRWCFDTFRLPGIVRQYHPSVILCLGNRGVDGLRCPQAILCHDPHLFYSARHFSKELLTRKLVKGYHKRRLKRDLRRTNLLLCQTEVAEKRLRETFAHDGPTAICPNAVSRWAIADEGGLPVPEPLAPLADRWKLLCLTRYYPHKNLEAIVRVFDRFREHLRDTTVLLTIAEDQHPHARRLLRSIRQKGLQSSIRNVGPLRQAELAGYYRHCDALLLPTLLESFSATYVEAMSFDCPILTSDLDFARGVCGDAAVYFDPWNPESIKNAIVKLKEDDEVRRDFPARARRQLERISKTWDDIAVDLDRELVAMVEGHRENDLPIRCEKHTSRDAA